MPHRVVVLVGLAWGAIALLLCVPFFGLGGNDLFQMAPSFCAAAIGTSYVVTWLFRRRLFGENMRKEYGLPFLTIPTGAAIWMVLVYAIEAVRSVIKGFDDIFDGFLMALPFAVIFAATIALPLTYPAAYATQRALARFGTPRVE